ncbi:hypothetical protein [Vibrio owensii]|uniref:hypothetical protein n=1 Tax=Vibrio harveyi group TaxID=717610 RepID=UPI003CC67EBF
MNGNTRTAFVIKLNEEQTEFALNLHQLLNDLHSNASEEVLIDIIEGKNNSNNWKELSSKYGDALIDHVFGMFEQSGALDSDFFTAQLFNVSSFPKGLKVYGEEFLEDFLAAFVQTLVTKFELRPVLFSIAYSSEDFIEDEFGGMAFRVSVDDTQSFSTQEWIDSF